MREVDIKKRIIREQFYVNGRKFIAYKSVGRRHQICLAGVKVFSAR